ncbi:MAG: site-specific integrase, partial [Candidatus Bathyarchaeota archaeon]|nr:site-specific integrase [Candidatus Bathyarchaeota archaeon]
VHRQRNPSDERARPKKEIAQKLKNPRLMKIHFHTFRHWKATMEYHKTKDLLHVKQLLGHKNVNNTMLYTQLIHFEGDEYHVKVAKTLEEVKELLAAGFTSKTTMASQCFANGNENVTQFSYLCEFLM